MRLHDVLVNTDVTCPAQLENLEIKGIAFNSEEVSKGDAFVCIKGNSGNEDFYAMDAAFNGAAVIISDVEINLESLTVLHTENGKETLSILSHNFFKGDNSSSKEDSTRAEIREITTNKAELVFGEAEIVKTYETINEKKDININMVGITGTNGKTTVSYLIKNIFESNSIPCGIIGTINYSFGSKVYSAINTTPEYCYLEKLLLEMQDEKVNNCVMEVSSQALDLGRVDEIQFDYGVFTNLSQDHLDYHKDMESYFASKLKLFLMTKKCNIINIDDDYGKKLFNKLKAISKAELISYSISSEEADFYCTIEEETAEHSKITVYEDGTKLGDITINSPGAHMISNAMAALACARSNHIGFNNIRSAIMNMAPIPGRFDIVDNDKDRKIIIDFAHTPVALKSLLETVYRFKKGDVYCVFGCGGDRDKDKRGKMGKIAGEYADYVIITSDNPRTENQDQIAEDIEGGLYDSGCNYEIIPDRREAIKRAVDLSNKDDIVVIAGKGHETYQIIGNEKHYFDDKETVIEILEGK